MKKRILTALAAAIAQGAFAADITVSAAASLTDAFGDLRGWRGGLGLLPGSFCPHLDGEDRGAVYTQAVASGMIPGGYGVDDGAALHFVDGELSRVLAEREGAHALHVMPSDEPTASGVLTEILSAS